MTKKPILYLIAAAWNTSIGLSAMYSFFINPKLVFFKFENFVPSNPLAHGFMMTLCSTVLLYGFSYYLIYRNLTKFQGLILLGILGKMGIALFIPSLYLRGLASELSLCLAMGDLVFSFFFFRDVKKLGLIRSIFF